MVITIGPLLVLFIYQLTVGSIDNWSIPIWLFIILLLLFCGISFFIAETRRLKVIIDAESITVSFGILRYRLPWNRINGYRLDYQPGKKYGWGGIHIAGVDGKHMLIYKAKDHPIVTLDLNTGRFRRFAFSTRYPDAVADIIQQKITEQ